MGHHIHICCVSTVATVSCASSSIRAGSSKNQRPLDEKKAQTDEERGGPLLTCLGQLDPEWPQIQGLSVRPPTLGGHNQGNAGMP